MNERRILKAEEGTVLTNGTVYGRVIYLAEGADESEWHEITDAEYREIMSSKQENLFTLEEEVQ